MLNFYDAYLLGYYGMQNSGDDALMQATIWGAKQQLQCRRLKFSQATKQSFKGQQRLRHYLNAFNSKRLIIGGGSVLHSEKDIAQKRHMLKLADPSKSLAIGVGIGPFANMAAEHQCQRFLQECGFVGVRDPQSFELARSLVPGAHVKLTFDLAPSLLANETLNISQVERKGIAFNFCQLALDAFGNTDSRGENLRIKRAVELISLTWQATGEPIFLLDFNGHPQLGDQHIHKAILNMLPAQVSVTHVPYDPNPYRLLQRLTLYKAMVGMRLHAAILSYMVNTPVLFLHYHSKCQQWSEQIGLAPEYQFNANAFEPSECCVAICNGLVQGFVSPRLPLITAVEQSLLNWSFDYEQHSVFRRHPALQQAQ